MQEAQKMGMITKIWGPAAWLFLHSIAYNFTPQKTIHYKQFFKSLAFVLPCKKCRENYNNIITNSELKIQKNIFKSRKTFSFWLFKLHNKVQQDVYIKSGLECEKPMFDNSITDFKKVTKMYESFRSKCSNKSYGCTIPKKGIKLRSQIIIKRFNNKCAQQKMGIIFK